MNGRIDKAMGALLVPVILSLLSWMQTGELNHQELALGLSGLLSFVAVYFLRYRDDEPRV